MRLPEMLRAGGIPGPPGHTAMAGEGRQHPCTDAWVMCRKAWTAPPSSWLAGGQLNAITSREATVSSVGTV